MESLGSLVSDFLLRVMVTSSKAASMSGFSATNNNISLVEPRDSGAFHSDEIRKQFDMAERHFGVRRIEMPSVGFHSEPC